MKKYLALFLAIAMIVGLVACGANKQPTETTAAQQGQADQSKDQQPSDQAQQTTVANDKENSQAPADQKQTEQSKSDKDGADKDKAPAGHGQGKADNAPPAPLEAAAEQLTIRHNIDKNAPFVIKYPPMLAKTFGPELKLPKYPEKIVDLSTSSLFLMSKLGVEPIAVSRTVKNTRARIAYGKLKTIDSGMNTVDTEGVIALQPDLVIMNAGMREKFGKVLEGMKIPVYYTSEGPIVTYEVNKTESLILAEAFGGPEAKEDVSKLYADIEAKAAAYAKAHQPTTAAILFGMDSSFQAATKSFVGSLIKMLGFENISDKMSGPPATVMPASFENIIKANPATIFLVAPPTGYKPEILKAAFMKRVTTDKALWDNVDAIKNNRVLALSGNYTTSKGLEVILDIQELITRLEAELK